MILLCRNNFDLIKKEIDENSIFYFSKDVREAYNKDGSFKVFYFTYHVRYTNSEGFPKSEQLFEESYKLLKEKLGKKFTREKHEQYRDKKGKLKKAINWTFFRIKEEANAL